MTRRGAGVVALAALLAPLLFAGPAAAAPRATGAPVTVSVVVPITAPETDGVLLDAETLVVATSPSGTLTRDLDAVLATSATIALDPRIPVSIRALGTAAPESATEWLTRLEAAPNDVFLLAYADADLSALARADALDVAANLDVAFALDAGDFGPPQTPTPTPTETATPAATEAPADGTPPPLPTSEELLAWPAAIGRIAWPAEGSVATGDVAAYDTAGYDALLLSSANVSETASALADLDGMPAIVADTAASGLMRQASAALDDATRTQAIDRLGVAIDGLAAAHPGRSIVLTLDRASTSSLVGLVDTYRALVAREGTRIAGLSAVLEGTSDSARVVDGAEPEHVTRTPSLLAALTAEHDFATILADPTLLTSPRRLQLLALLSVSAVESAAWSSEADAFLDRSREILDSVTIVDTGDILVASSSTSIPIHVANALDYPVTVRIDVRPLRPRIRIDSPVELTIEPGSSKAVRLPAQAITNGEVVVVVSLSSPGTGEPIGQSRGFNVDLQAQWETVGIVVGAVLVLVFLAGIARNVVLRRRRAAAEGAADAGAASTGDPE